MFHSTGTAVAKPRLPVAFQRRTEKTDNLFLHVRLLYLIRDDKWGWGGAWEASGFKNKEVVFEQNMV